MYSPNEAFFYAHHAFIDKLYREWEQASPSNKFMPDAALDTVMQPWGLTARDVLSKITPCVRYGASTARTSAFAAPSATAPGARQDAVQEAAKAEADGEAAALLFGASQEDIAAAKRVADEILGKQGLTPDSQVA
jgi:hypothetical protein